jgi:hypothetical protein
MTHNTHQTLVSELLSQLNASDKVVWQSIINGLNELEYLPQKQKVQGYVLSFINKKVNQTIAKMGVKKGKAFFGLKFYACKNLTGKFQKAVELMVISTNGRYRCTDCGICKAVAGERGYRYTYPDGREFIQCGAYIVEIPGLTPDDVPVLTGLLDEQHRYFTQIA